MFVYQPTFSELDIKVVNGEFNVSAWKSKGIYNSGLKPSHDRAPVIKYFEKLKTMFYL